jgi:hypothetical protein
LRTDGNSARGQDSEALDSYAATCQIGTEFANLDLRGADFSGADLSYARFVDCDLYEANFDGAMLYHCTFVDCELTKATFLGAYLSGFRLRGNDLTHAKFDRRPSIGVVRKPLAVANPAKNFLESRGWLTVDTGEPLPSIATIEGEYKGIYCPSFRSAVVFSDDPVDEQWRSSRRREEVCKILRVQLLANGYADKALDFYFEERRFRRKAMVPSRGRWLKRLWDFLAGELFWGYSTRPFRPVAAYGIVVAIVGAAFVLLPGVAPGNGMRLVATDSADNLVLDSRGALSSWLQTCYFLVTCAAGVSGFEPIGTLGQLLFAAYCIVSLAILTYMFAAIARRIGQS